MREREREREESALGVVVRRSKEKRRRRGIRPLLRFKFKISTNYYYTEFFFSLVGTALEPCASVNRLVKPF